MLEALMYGGGFAVSQSLAGLLEPVSKQIVSYCLKLVTYLEVFASPLSAVNAC